MTLTVDNHFVKTLGFYAQDEAFYIGIHIWACHSSLYTLDTSSSQDSFEILGKWRIPVMDQELFILQEADYRICGVPGSIASSMVIGLVIIISS